MATDRRPFDAPSDAAGWVARLGSDQRTRADEDAFQAWIADDPSHRAIFNEHAAIWNGMGAIEDRDAARTMLMGDASDAAPVDRRRAMAAIGGVASLLGGAAVAPALWRRLAGTGDRLVTEAGRQRLIRLADNSVVTLDADAVVDTVFGDHERRLSLIRGRAFFEVAHDAARPFRVLVDGMEVRALGTGFTVTRERAGASVVLEHGAVAIFHDVAREAKPDAILRPGEHASVSRRAPVAIGHADLPRTQAWRFGRLVFDNATLASAIADVNRYGGPRIVLADERIGTIGISGVFHVGQPEAFVDTVTAAVPVQVAYRDGSTIILAAG